MNLKHILIVIVLVLLSSVFFSCKENPTKSDDDTSSTPDPNGSEVIIGNNELSISVPFGSEGDARQWTQILYLANEIGESGTIKGLALMASTTLPGTYTKFEIFLQEVTRNELDNRPWKNNEGNISDDDWKVLNLGQLVYGAEEIDQNKWHNFTFDNAFSYNGTDNLLVDIRRNTSGGTASVDVYGFNTINSNRIVSVASPYDGVPGTLQEKALYVKLLFN